jgi:formylglycine-generating enzyme required for sulfatase activity
VVAGALTVRHIKRMHRAGLAGLAILATWQGSVRAEQLHGRIVKIDAPRRVEVRVPGGKFEMGVDEATAGAAHSQCETVFSPISGISKTGQRVDFCGDYYETLLAMAPRDVYIDEFRIDRDEVSVTEYRACVAAGACPLDPLIAGDERYIRSDWPMVNATWYEAQMFCHWRGGRLPSEAEWERAARGDNPAATWPWGELEQPNDFNHGQPRAVAMREIERQTAEPLHLLGDPDASDGHAILAPPGSYVWGEGPYGTRDQAGNVAEWTADAFVWDPDPKKEDRGYARLGTVNPYREGKVGDPRVVRGGSWRQPTFIARSNLRDPFNRPGLLYDPNGRYTHVGFRCARGHELSDTVQPLRDPFDHRRHGDLP